MNFSVLVDSRKSNFKDNAFHINYEFQGDLSGKLTYGGGME